MGTAIVIFLILFGLSRMVHAAPGAIRFGMENREAVRGGINLLERFFGR
jgi:hypothetical protein